MRPTLTAVLEAGKQTKHCDDVQRQLLPMLTLSTDLQQYVVDHRRRLFETQAEDSSDDGNLDRLHQTLGALETDVKALQDILRRIRMGVLQYQRYCVEIERDVSAREARDGHGGRGGSS